MTSKILSKLVSFKTLSLDHKENKNALDWYKNELKGLPVYFKDFNFNGFPSLLVTTKKTKKPKILLICHMDVVGGSEKVFKPKIQNGKLFGRGVFDMKFAAACYLKLFLELGKNLKNHNLGILLSTDEELGGRDGIKRIVQAGYSCDFFVLPDGGENWTVQKSAKGIIQLSVQAVGKSAHGSRPWAGSNAVEILCDFLDEFKKIFPKEPCKDPEHFHSTANVGKISGGEEINKIPDFAEALIDIRLVPKSKDALFGRIKKLANKYPEISLKIISEADSYSINTNDSYFKNFVKILQNKIGFMPELIDSHGSSDARYFVKQNIPGILLRPVGSGHHTENEWIDVKSLELFYEVLKEFVENNN